MSVEKYQQALSLRASGLVKRWHTAPMNREQTVAEHSGQALSLLFMLHPDPSVALIKALLWHDSSERVVGDVPAPIRRQRPDFAAVYEDMERIVAATLHPDTCVNLMHDDRRWLKAIDVLELVLHCQDEIMLGNVHAGTIKDRGISYLRQDELTPTEVINFLQWWIGTGADYRSLV